MTTFMQLEVDCPCCGTKFDTHVLTSTNNFGGQTTDFHQRAVGFEPLAFMISTCPECGFTAASEGFSRAAITDDLRRRVNFELRPLVADRVPDTPKQYEFAALIAGWRGDGAERVGDLYLRAAWCAAEFGSRSDELRYRQAAIEHFEQTLDFEVLPDERRLTLTYLVGELYRRIDQADTAREWFDRVLAEADGSDDASIQRLAAAARQQRDEPHDTF